MQRKGAGDIPLPVGQSGRALVFGEVLFDHFPDGGKVLGGAPFNVAWHLCGFGTDPILVSAVGADAEGREALEEMGSWGLSTSGVAVVEDYPTGRVLVGGREHDPTFEIPPDQAWDHLPVDLEVDPDLVGLIYHGTLAVRTDGAWTAFRALADRLGAPVLVDVNLRAPWWKPARAREALDAARWLKLNAQELAEITGRTAGTTEECESAASALARRHDIHRVVVTRGSEGSLSVSAKGIVAQAEATAVADLVDTVGAGDAFSAALCQGILHGWSEQVTLDRASAFAAEVCRVQGATNTDLSVYERHLRSWSNTPWTDGEADESRPGLYILSLSVHGLVRGKAIELGRDADTGGQVSYVVDQARALARHPGVERVEVVTRQVIDRKLDDSYAREMEEIGPGARILRFPFGPRRYLRKESLWPHLDSLLDQLTRYVRSQPRPPDVIHSHYADAGYVGAQLSKLLGAPFVFTGHSLGEVKRARLIEDGADPEELEERYRISRRIEAEEQALETAALVIASTRQEVEEQYRMYDRYAPDRMAVIPPGVDLDRFSPPPRLWGRPPIALELDRFLRDPTKPMVLCIARPDERKNFAGLVHAFGATPGLRELANLVLVAGTRDVIGDLDSGARRVLTEILLLIDRYDLYGSAAYPRDHGSEDIPDLYRLAARSRGLFVNPALTEPFGLTLIEAAATGLPVVATRDGGPVDIVGRLENGVLVDPLDREALGSALLESLRSGREWAARSKRGLARVHESFSWRSHASAYVEAVRGAVAGTRPASAPYTPRTLTAMDRILVTDFDGTLSGDAEGLAALRARVSEADVPMGFGIATGRTLLGALEALEALKLPIPDVLITGSGTEMHYGENLTHDRSWERQIRYHWEPDEVRRALGDLDGLEAGEAGTSSPYRLRFVIDPARGPEPAAIRRRLRKAGVRATVVVDHDTLVDVMPVRASPGLAIRFFGFKWNVPAERMLVAGDSGNDADMLSGETLGVVVANHTGELESLRGLPRVHFAEASNAWGILEGIEHYEFLGAIRIPDDEDRVHNNPTPDDD